MTCNISHPHTPLSPLSFPSLILFSPPLLSSFYPLSTSPTTLLFPSHFSLPLFSHNSLSLFPSPLLLSSNFLAHSFSQLSLHIPYLFSLSLPFLTSIPPLLSPSSPVFDCLPSLLACELAHLCEKREKFSWLTVAASPQKLPQTYRSVPACRLLHYYQALLSPLLSSPISLLLHAPHISFLIPSAL